MPGELAPHSAQAEEAVLGSVLINPDCYLDVVATITDASFYLLRHAYIWRALAAVYQRGENIDILSVADQLRSSGQLDEIGGSAYLTGLINATPTYSHVETYAGVVQRLHWRRLLLASAAEQARIALDENVDIDAGMDKAVANLVGIRDGANRDRLTWAEALAAHYNQLEEIMEHKVEYLGLPTGYKDLDNLLSGLQKGSLHILAGRPGMGKTAFLGSLVSNTAKLSKARVGFLSLEMGTDQVLGRLISLETGIDSKRLAIGKLTDEEWDRYIEAQLRMSQWAVEIDDQPGITLGELRGKLRNWQRQIGLDLVIVDYLGLMHAEKRRMDRYEEVSAVARGLKELAREFNVPFVVACQLSRDVEKRSEKIPQLSDLRESGEIEQAADVVIFLYRDDVYDDNSKRPNQADLVIAKHRNGPTGTVTLYFDKPRMAFLEMATKKVNLNAF